MSDETKDAAAEAEQAIPPGTSSLRLVLTLVVAGVAAGLLLVVADGITAPAIAAYKKEQQELAATEVLGGAASLEKYLFADGALHVLGADEAEPPGSEVLFRGTTEAGELVGWAMPAERFGYADVIYVMAGFDPTEDTLLGMKVLGNRETPGLGDGILKNEAYIGQFPGRKAPLVATKGAAGGPSDVDTITGATISSTAVIDGINDAVARYGAALDDLEASR